MLVTNAQSPQPVPERVTVDAVFPLILSKTTASTQTTPARHSRIPYRPSLTFRVTLAAAANLGVPVFVHPILPRMCASLLRLTW